MTAHYGTSGNDFIDGGNGTDDLYGGDGDDIILGGNGGDVLDGGAGNDQLYGQNGNENMYGGAGDDLIDGNNGFDIAYYSGLIEEYTFLASAGYLHIIHQGGAGADGHDKVIRVERLVFADRIVNIGSGANRPVAIDDHVFINEETGAHSSGSAGVLSNDFDFDGDPLTVTGGTFVGTYGTLVLSSNGTYTYTLSASAQALAAGETGEDSFNYTVSDNDGSDTGKLVFHIAGLNDAPTANPDGATGDENQILLIDVLANDSDVDNGAVLTVTAASAPAGQGSASVVDNQVQFDPGSDFDSLAAGDSVDVVVGYDIVDEHGATASSFITITVTGTNDDPAANPETDSTSENAAITIDVLANDTDADNGAVLTVTAASAPAGQGSASVVGNQVEFDPGTDFDDLAVGESEIVIVDYTIEDEHGASSSSTVTITVTGTNDGPVANPDIAAAGENETILVDVLANDEDADNGAILTVTAASVPAGQGIVSVVGNQVEFDPGTDFDSLAAGASVDVVVSYDIVDEHGATSSSTATITVNGANDDPVASPETASTSENASITVDVLANDTDVDDGAALTVASASAPAGQGSASVVGNQVEFDPGTDFDNLAVGDSEIVVVSYTVEDEHGGSSSSTVTITVTGTNDGPVANPDTRTTSENSAVVIAVLGNDVDVDREAVLTVTAASLQGSLGSVTIVEDQVRFDPGDDFDHLASGESEVVVIDYTIQDEHGESSSSTVTVTVLGRDAGTNNTGTNDGETLVGTPGDDTIDALGGDDTVFGLPGDDLIFGGDGNDFLLGEEDNDIIDGGTGEDFLAGGEGNDELVGQAGSDNAIGEGGDDQITGGAGFDVLSGDSGDDIVSGGNDDDLLFGGEDDDILSGEAGNDGLFGESGNDVLSGGADNDSLDGGEGDDDLDGGDGDDFLSDTSGTNSFVGGLGSDQIIAGSGGGLQSVDGGGGNDSIRHYFRNFASTIVTGTGSDTIEIAHADQGSEAIVVTDFTPGAGGDVFQLSGSDGSLLSLLTNWDGGSNPFGSGHLRLQQDDSDTLLQWDRDGSGTDSGWETLAVLENTLVGAFTEANFEPAYHPNGADPAGETITGTAEDDSLVGTVGADTIDGLGGNDSVFGQAGGDLINGGDGVDQLHGEGGDDTINGGNDDDLLFGGSDDDLLSGEAGNDGLFGESGNDQLSGGADNDSLDGGDGNDTLIGGDGDDFLGDVAGTNSFAGGLGSDQIMAAATDGAQTIDGGGGNDTIRHSFRNFASSIATGAGSDTIELAYVDQGTEAIAVTDFTPGAGGDRFRLSGGEGSVLSLLVGWDGSSNPFDSGFLRLQQDDSDTLLQWDRDGAGTESGWETLAVVENTLVAAFTEANFEPAYDPDGSDPAGQTINGTADDDTLTGTVGGDTINGLGGDDTVFGKAGDDSIAGGDGSDQLYGEAGDDVVGGGNDEDIVRGGDGADTLSGEAGNDGLFGENGNDQLAGGDGDDSLDGGDGDDALAGGVGVDFLSGGMGADVLTGGLNGDRFNFQSASEGADEITDFAGGADLILVSASGFGGGLNPFGSVSLVSGSDPAASQASGQFLYDTDDGRLLWDVDGTGSEDPVLIATLASVPSLEASDFFVLF